MRSRALFAAGLFFAVRVAHAVVIFDGLGTGSGSAPSSDPGFANIGSIGGGASAIYLGNYGGEFWAMTATHVGAGDLVLSSGTYNYVPGSAVTIANGDTSLTDMTIFRVATDPLLPNLTLASSIPSPVSIVRMIGNGTHEDSNGTAFWNVTANPGANNDTWVQTGTGPGDISGLTLGGSGKRWGDAFMIGTSSYTVNGHTQSGIVTEFDVSTGSSQAASGDSGGAMFYKNGSTWELLGLLSAVSSSNSGGYDNQPGNAVVNGNLTFAVSIPDYRNAILTAIPEPATTAVWIGGAIVGVVGIIRRRRV